MDRKLKENLIEWHDKDEFEKIIAAIRKEPEEELDYDLKGQLARALNNIDEYGEALEILESIKEEGKEDACWFYRKGYALHGLERYAEARDNFQKAAELDPEDQDAPEFIRMCSSALAFPFAIKPFSLRVAEFWAGFELREAELRSKMDDKGNYIPAMDLASELLHIAFSEIYFEMGHNGEKYELILTAEGEKQRLFRMEYWKNHAPKELEQQWIFTVGRPVCGDPKNCAIQMFNISVCGGEVKVWPEILEDNMVGLNVYSEELVPLLKEDESKAYSLMAILIDQCIGEIAAIRNVAFLDIMSTPELSKEVKGKVDGDKPIFLNELRSFLLSVHDGDAEKAEGLGSLCDLYSSYRLEPKEKDWWLREDIFIGNTSCIPIISDYYNDRVDIAEENMRDGVVIGFLYYNNNKVEQSQMVPFRGEIEDEISGLMAESGRIIGGATGNVYSYIDCICYNLGEFLDAAAEVMNKRELEEIGFHVFRKDCGGVNLKRTEEERESGN